MQEVKARIICMRDRRHTIQVILGSIAGGRVLWRIPVFPGIKVLDSCPCSFLPDPQSMFEYVRDLSPWTAFSTRFCHGLFCRVGRAHSLLNLTPLKPCALLVSCVNPVSEKYGTYAHKSATGSATKRKELVILVHN